MEGKAWNFDILRNDADRREIATVSGQSWKLGGCWSRSRGRVLQRDYCGAHTCVGCVWDVCRCICVRGCAREMPLYSRLPHAEVIESDDELNNGATERCKWIGSRTGSLLQRRVGNKRVGSDSVVSDGGGRIVRESWLVISCASCSTLSRFSLNTLSRPAKVKYVEKRGRKITRETRKYYAIINQEKSEFCLISTFNQD